MGPVDVSFNWKWFRNDECEFFPCHHFVDYDNFNCKFCFCPLYRFEDCGGNPTILQNGVRDCSGCTYPHDKRNHDEIIRRLS